MTPRPPQIPTTGLTTALVTGANRGLGLEVCRQLAARGLTVYLSARDLGKARAAAASIAGDVRPVELDVDAPFDAPSGASRLAQEIGAVDVLVNNAAIHYDNWQTAESANERIVREAFETNFFGAWRVLRAFAPAMRARGRGRIVNVSSEAGSLASMDAGTPAYATSKAALNALTKIFAAELAGSGVLVNAVCPGWTATDMGGGGRPIPEGAASIVWAALLPDDGPTGGFFRDGERLDW